MGAGDWLTKHKAATTWVLGGVGAFAPVLGLTVWVGVAAWAAVGAVQALASESDRMLAKKQEQGPKSVAPIPPPKIGLDLVP